MSHATVGVIVGIIAWATTTGLATLWMYCATKKSTPQPPKE